MTGWGWDSGPTIAGRRTSNWRAPGLDGTLRGAPCTPWPDERVDPLAWGSYVARTHQHSHRTSVSREPDARATRRGSDLPQTPCVDRGSRRHRVPQEHRVG